MQSVKGLVILDRDGVLNRVVVHPEQGTVDSPLNPSEVELLPGVAEGLVRLTRAGWILGIATNQPAAAKGKTTRENLQATHARVVELAQAQGGRVWRSEICLHASGEGCPCRKPKPGMLLTLREAFEAEFGKASQTWMVGDGVTDVQAAQAAGLRAAFLGPRKCDACRIHEDLGLRPEFWGDSLPAFIRYLGES